MRSIAVIVIVSLLVLGIATAIHTQETRYSVDQNIIEQRDILFSQNRLGYKYVKPLGGFGFKGASRGSFGFKDSESSFANLATNAFRKRGRDPSHISNIYSSARGYFSYDEAVELKPVNIGLVSRPLITTYATAVARIVSQNVRGLRIPRGTVFLRTRDLPPIGRGEVYEAWLVDEDSGYSQSMGFIPQKSIGRTGTLSWEIHSLLTSYDSIMITKEPYPDPDPSPSEPILIGSLWLDQVTQ